MNRNFPATVSRSDLTLATMSVCLFRRLERRILGASRLPWARLHSSMTISKFQTDSCGIPLQPTWSVNDLLSSYPTPTITSSTLRRLHELSALIPPAEDTQEHDILKQEMENLVKLVEAVKLVDVKDGSSSADAGMRLQDGRVWADGTGTQSVGVPDQAETEISGSALLRFASRTSDGLYVVDADRAKR